MKAIKWIAVVLCVALVNVIFAQGPVRVPSEAESIVTGNIRVIAGEEIVPLRGVPVRFLSAKGTQYEASSDPSGLYAVRLPAGAYSVVVTFGPCSIRRAAFELGKGDKVTFDFMLPRCAIYDGSRDGPPGFSEPSIDRAPKLDTPLDKQPPAYREEVIAAKNVPRTPEIVVAFGKYDNHDDSIEYYSLQFEHSLVQPVTVTVGTYTMLANSVTLNRHDMVFLAKGNVTIEDGHGNIRQGSSATLTFTEGKPTFEAHR